MGTALDIRQDYTADDLRQLARKSLDADWSCRLLALSVIYEGCSRNHAASIGGVGLQIIRDWAKRFNQQGPAGLKTGKAKGREPLLNDKQRKALIKAVEKGPVPHLDGAVRWRLVDLLHSKAAIPKSVSVSSTTVVSDETTPSGDGYAERLFVPEHE